MRELTKQNLDELAKTMPVLSEQEQRLYVAGGTLINRNGIVMLYNMENNQFVPVNPFTSATGGSMQYYALASAGTTVNNDGDGDGNSGYFGSGDYPDSGNFGTGFYDDDVFVDSSGNRYKGYFDEDGNWVFLDDTPAPGSGMTDNSGYLAIPVFGMRTLLNKPLRTTTTRPKTPPVKTKPTLRLRNLQIYTTNSYGPEGMWRDMATLRETAKAKC